MRSLTVTLMSPSAKAVHRLAQLLQEQLNALLPVVAIEPELYEKHADLHIRAKGTAWTKLQTKQIVDVVSETLVSYILQEEEARLLTDCIVHDYGYAEAEESQRLLGYCRQIMEKDARTPEARTRREQKMVRSLRTFLNEQEAVNLDGFLQFRANEYREELNEVVEYAIDEYLMDKQYQEFISLLKYFVYIQDTKIPAAHLMHKGGHEFVLLNEQLKPIDTTQLDSTFTVELMDKEINFEDLIVSTLITVAPQQIHIHTRDPELQVVKTIEQIFEGRVTVCEYCRKCKPVLGERKRQDQLST